jgi:hypothetical protein
MYLLTVRYVADKDANGLGGTNAKTEAFEYAGSIQAAKDFVAKHVDKGALPSHFRCYDLHGVRRVSVDYRTETIKAITVFLDND